MRIANVTVKSDDQIEEFRGVRLPLELGRQRRDEPDWLRLQNLGNHHRIAIAPLMRVGVPREFIRVDEAPDGLRLLNIHARSNFFVSPGVTPVKPGEQVSPGEAVTIAVAEGIEVVISLVDASSIISDDTNLRTLQGSGDLFANEDSGGKLADLLNVTPEQNAGQVAVSLVRQALSVVQEATGSDEYFMTAVRAAANMIELDRAYIILYHNKNWTVRAKYSFNFHSSLDAASQPESEALPSGSAMLRQRVLLDKRTVLYEPGNYMHTTGSSMMALDRAVAAPMLDESGEVIGVLYGDRKFDSDRSDKPIGELEAALLEVIAGAVATGLARQREESLRASMTQFFSPSVTARLNENDNLLSGRDAEVTVLFCDIRGFSGISERVGPGGTIEWINDVLTELSQCVLDTDGVLVDYVGDELMAMWGAPEKQPDHSVRACITALQMLGKIGLLKDRWDKITPDHFGFGIGINTGPARVGNTGSKVKFKYGPLGNVVNVASRIQGMTKRFGVPAIVTGATYQAVRALSAQTKEPPYAFRRLADVQPLGVKEIVTLYQLNSSQDKVWKDVRAGYEKALKHYHENDLTGAARELATLVHEHPSDSPSVQLLGRVVNSLTKHESEVNPVIVFESK